MRFTLIVCSQLASDILRHGHTSSVLKANDPGVVDEDVEAAEAFVDVGVDPSDRLLVAHIER